MLKHGPFDGILGFSQVGTLQISVGHIYIFLKLPLMFFTSFTVRTSGCNSGSCFARDPSTGTADLQFILFSCTSTFWETKRNIDMGIAIAGIGPYKGSKDQVSDNTIWG